MDDGGPNTEERSKAAGRAFLHQHALIAGEPVTAAATISVDDPAEETILGTVPRLGEADVERAVQAASEVFGEWSGTPALERGAILRRWAALIDDNLEGLGALISLENDKPFAEAVAEAAYANQFVKWFAGEA